MRSPSTSSSPSTSALPNLIAMDVEFYNALPDDLKAIIDEAGNEAGKYASQLDKENEAVALEELANDHGMTICEIEDKTGVHGRCCSSVRFLP